MSFIFFSALFFLFLIEISCIVLIQWLKKDFQWLITSENVIARFDSENLDKFISHGFDGELGWERKANTSKEEQIKTAGEKRQFYNSSIYSINSKKARSNPGHEMLPNIISSYGDSFAFSRHVNDDQTWQWHLSDITRSNVSNFGVGNFGIDQALLKLKREFPNHRTKIVIMMVVPETIVRIVNVWKHYCEYGNTFGFKGRFVVKKDKLIWLENPINEVGKFKLLNEYIKWIQKNDYCYEHKFKKDLITFPYSLTILKNHRRNIPLIKALLESKLNYHLPQRSEDGYNRAWEIILERNFQFTTSLYENQEITDLFLKIVYEYQKFVEEQESIPIFVMVPYLHDLYHIQKKGHYYGEYLKKIKSCLFTLDLSEHFLQNENPESLYVSPYYAAHLSNKGNRFLSEKIFEFMKLKKLMPINKH